MILAYLHSKKQAEAVRHILLRIFRDWSKGGKKRTASAFPEVESTAWSGGEFSLPDIVYRVSYLPGGDLDHIVKREVGYPVGSEGFEGYIKGIVRAVELRAEFKRPA